MNRRASLLVLLGAAQLGGACAGARVVEPGQGNSLVVARWTDYAHVPYGCPADSICLDVLADARLREVRTLSGPPVPSRLTVRLWFHNDPRRDLLHLMIVKPPTATEPYWRAVRPIDAGKAGDEVCVPTTDLREEAIAAPRAARVRGERACVRL